jgi:hypothetical protein
MEVVGWGLSKQIPLSASSKSNFPLLLTFLVVIEYYIVKQKSLTKLDGFLEMFMST